MYLVILVFSVLVCAVIGLCGWCLWRFFKKKRPKDGKKKKDGKTDGVSKTRLKSSIYSARLMEIMEEWDLFEKRLNRLLV